MFCRLTAVPKDNNRCPDFATCSRIRFEKPGPGLVVTDHVKAVCAACRRVRARMQRARRIYFGGDNNGSRE